MASLEFTFEPGVEEAAVGCLGNLHVSLAWSEFAYHSRASTTAHGMLAPAFDLEILPGVRVVSVEHRNTAAPGRVDQVAGARDHRDSPVAFDLAIHEVVQHIDDEDSVPAILVVDMRRNRCSRIVEVYLFNWAFAVNPSQESSGWEPRQA